MRKLKRKELFEFTDWSYTPNFIRDAVTELLGVLHRLIGSHKVIANLIIEAREKVDFNQIIDLGSGSGGPMVKVSETLSFNQKTSEINIILSDLNPNGEVITSFNDVNDSKIRYSDQPVDACDFKSAPRGLKTMIASFHHLKPESAQKVLKSAQDYSQPILIFELAKNNIPFLLWLLFLPFGIFILILMALVMTPFIKQLTIRQILFTYVVPIIPLVYAWDGQVSVMRTYTSEDIETLLPVRSEEYSWVINEAYNSKGKKSGNYVMGLPIN